jgi:hypothetical protein
MPFPPGLPRFREFSLTSNKRYHGFLSRQSFMLLMVAAFGNIKNPNELLPHLSDNEFLAGATHKEPRPCNWPGCEKVYL